MGDSDDYDEAADRVAGEVPDNLDGQAQIRDYIEDNIDWGHKKGSDTDILNREVADRIAQERSGSGSDSGDSSADTGRKIYDPNTGGWRDAESGQFSEAPDE